MRGAMATDSVLSRGVARAVTLATLVASLALGGCERETTPPLIQVQSLSPREVEEGDRVTIDGVGFPEGKTAHVAFRGDLHRPGLPAVRDVEVDVDAVVLTGTALDLPITPHLEQLFAGAGDHGAHTTFSGDVTVAFAARSTAAPPVAGTLHDIWLDIRPPTPHHALASIEAGEGERTLAFLGIKPESTPVPAGGILIASIEPGSRAETARLLAGDVIAEMNGVRVLSTRDLLAAPGDRVAWLKIRRGGSPREELATVSLLGLRPPAATALLAPVVVLCLAAILLLLFFAPTPGIVAWLERHIGRELRARPVVRAFPGARTPYVLGVGVSAMFALLPFAHYLGLGDLDAGILFLASLTALATLALFTGGSRPGRPYRIVAAIGASWRVVSLAVPAAAAVVAVVIMTGSLRVEDLVRAQAGWPWGWTAFRSPIAFAVLALAFVSALAGGHVDDRPLPDAEGSARSVTPGGPLVFADPRARVLFLATWVHRLVLCTLAVALFLGGWQLPGLAPEQVEGHLGWTSLGAALFASKVWLAVGALAAAERALPQVRPEQAMSLTWRWLAPLSVGGVLLTALWTAWGPGPSVETLIGAVMVALACAAGLRVVTRVRFFQGDQGGELDPFI